MAVLVALLATPAFADAAKKKKPAPKRSAAVLIMDNTCVQRSSLFMEYARAPRCGRGRRLVRITQSAPFYACPSWDGRVRWAGTSARCSFGAPLLLPDGRPHAFCVTRSNVLRYTVLPSRCTRKSRIARVPTIAVERQTQPPLAAADAYATSEDTALLVSAPGVLGNDRDAGGAPLGAALVSGPAQAASFALAANGSFSYTPAPQFSGTDSFTYQAFSGPGVSNPVTVTLTVGAVNDAPVHDVPAALATDEDTALSTTAFGVSDVDSGTGELRTALSVAHGTITLAGTSGLTFSQGDGTADASMELTGTAAAIDAALGDLEYDPAAGSSGADAITIATSDQGNTGGPAQSDTDSVPVTVSGVNDAPEATVPGAQSTKSEEDLELSTAGGNAIAIDDVDAGSGDVRVTLAAGEGTVTLASDTGLTFTAGDGTDDATTTFDGTLADIATALDGLVYEADTTYDGDDTLTVSVDDLGNTGSGGAQTDSGTITIDVDGTNDAPVNTVPGAQSVVENGTLTFDASRALGVSDPDDEGSDLQVTLSADDGTITLGSTTGIATTTDGSASVELTGPESAINAALADATYEPDAAFTGADTLTMATSDLGHTGADGAKTDTDTVAITVNALNKAPVNALPATVSVDEDDTHVFSAAGISDPDAGSTEDLQVELEVTDGTLTLDTDSGLTFTEGDGTADAQMTFTGTQGDLDAAVSGMVYAPDEDYNGSASLTMTTDDLGHEGEGGPQTDTDTVTITVGAVDDAPRNVLPAAQTTPEETALAISGLSVDSWPDGGDEAVTTHLSVAHGTLATGSDSGGSLDLSGSVDDVNAALADLIYTPDDEFSASDPLTVQTDDGDTAGTDTDTLAITVTGTNDAPVNTVPGGQTVAEDTNLVFSTGNGNALSVSDLDAAADGVEVTLSVDSGAITLSQLTGLTFASGDGAGDAAMTFSGSLSAVNAALDGAFYRGALNASGSATLTMVTSDLAHTGTGGAKTDTDTVGITITAVNDAPVNALPSTPTVDEDATLTLSGAAAVAIDDVDGGANPAKVTLTATNGAFSLDGTSGLSFSAGDGTGDAAATFTGTRANINAALDGMTFSPAGNFGGTAALAIVTSDQGSSGSGGAQTDSDSLDITVSPVNDAPSTTVPGAQTVDEDATTTFSAADGNQISVADVDAGSSDVKVTLHADHGVFTLNGTTGVTFTAGDGTDDATVTFKGSLTNVNARLDGLVYAPASDASDEIDVTIDDLGNTGSGGTLTATDHVAVTVVPLNDAPVNAMPALQATPEDTTLVLDGAKKISVSDGDAPAAALLAVDLSVTNGTLTLDGTTGLAFTTGDGTGDTTMSFTGKAADINAALDGLSYAPTGNWNGSAQLSITTDDQGATGAGGAQSDTDDLAITVSAVNDAPANTVPGAQTVDEDTALAFTTANGNALSVADVDAGSDQVKVTLAAQHGTTTITGATAGLTFTQGDGTQDATMAFAGTVTQVNAALSTVTYQGDLNYNGAEQLDVTTDDLGHNPAPAKSDHDAVAITVNPVNDAPVADDETFNGTNRAIGNTAFVANDLTDGPLDPTGPQKTITGDILDGDADVDSGPLTVEPGTFSSNDGGSVIVESDGDFVFHPKNGCSDQSDFFDYTVTDSHATDPRTDTGRVTIAILDCVWYVNTSAGPPPAGTAGSSHTPLNSLTGINGAGGSSDKDGSSDRIFLYPGTYAGGLPLESSQSVVSKRHGLVVPDGGAGTVTLETASPGATATAIDGGVVLASGNTLQGIDLGTTGSSSTFALSGTSVGTATVNTVTAGGIDNPAGGAVSITGSSNVLNMKLDEVTSSSSSSNAIGINNASGTFDGQDGTLASANGTTVRLDGGSLDFTFGGSLADDSGQLISIANQTGGTKDFNGPVNDNPSDGDGGGISLQSNTATTTTRFDGGLKLSTGPNHALTAASGGRLAIKDPDGANAITTTTGTPLSLTSTTIDDDDLTFKSISSNGAASGIVLNTTSNANGRLVVTGGDGSCTTALTCTGGAIQNSTSSGIRLESVPGGASLTRMLISGSGDDGVRAVDTGITDGSGITLASSRVASNGNSAAGGAEDRGLDWLNVRGTSSITDSTVTGNFESNAVVKNTSGTLRLGVTGSTFSGSVSNAGLQLLGGGTATTNASVTGSAFSGNRDSEFQLQSPGDTANGTMTLHFTGNTVTGNPAHSVPGQPGIYLAPGGTTQLKARIAGNTVSGTKGTAMIVGSGSGSAGSTTDVTVENNLIGTAAAGSGSQQGDGIRVSGDGSGQKRILVKNNDIQQWANKAMRIQSGDTGGGTVDFTITGNTMHNGGATRTDTIALAAGRASAAAPETVCADIGGSGGNANIFGGTAGSGSFDMTISERFATTLRLVGFTTGTDEQVYIRSRNGGSPTVVNIDNPVEGSAQPCAQPTLPPPGP